MHAYLQGFVGQDVGQQMRLMPDLIVCFALLWESLELRTQMLYFSAAQAPVDALLRDFANPRASDNYLPFVRNKDWYDGHSWASGVVPFAAGKNQVSTLALCRHLARTILLM